MSRKIWRGLGSPGQRHPRRRVLPDALCLAARDPDPPHAAGILGGVSAQISQASGSSPRTHATAVALRDRARRVRSASFSTVTEHARPPPVVQPCQRAWSAMRPRRSSSVEPPDHCPYTGIYLGFPLSTSGRQGLRAERRRDLRARSWAHDPSGRHAQWRGRMRTVASCSLW
jgi:hypothetical protein